MDWLGREVADPTGHRYARLDEVFVGRTSGEPEFGIVTLLDAGERVAVPLAGTRVAVDGALVLAVDDDRVRSAPRVQRDVDEIPVAAGRLINRHFGLGDEPAHAVEEDRAPAPDEAPTEVVRSEEQLSVGTRAEATERVRVRKRVVTEDVTLTVTVRREELVIEREPIAPGAADAATAPDFAFAEEGVEAEFVLHAEEPVVTKRVVPVERVRLHRETTTEDRHVTDVVRKERVDVDHLTPPREDPEP